MQLEVIPQPKSPFTWRRFAILILSTTLLALSVIPVRAARSDSPSTQRVKTALTEAAVPAGSNPIAAENLKKGSSAWKVAPPGATKIEGFASKTSILAGDRITIYVSTRSPRYSIEVYRLGWYQGDGGRALYRYDDLIGYLQPSPIVDPKTNMVETHWHPSLHLETGADWLTGLYVFVLRLPDRTGSYVPFVIRETQRHAPILFQSSVTTWQAYNDWGGHNLYWGRSRGGRLNGSERSTVVSFDRPYGYGNGGGDLLGLEWPLASWLEQNGYDVGYVTNVDTHEQSDLFADRKAFLSLGHDEYWSTPMRTHLESALAAGVNLAFFGANAMYRHIRLEASPLGVDRRQVNYRSARADPMTKFSATAATVQWRDPPLSRPEDSIMGAMYECNPVRGDVKVAATLPWLFKGTGLSVGDHLKGLLGTEYDRVYPRNHRDQSLWVLFQTPLRCQGRPSVQETVFGRFPSGAGVFDAGTSRFLCAFDGCQGAPKDVRVQKLVKNLLDSYLGVISPVPEPSPPPLTFSRPSDDNLGKKGRKASPSPLLEPSEVPEVGGVSPGNNKP